jgi:23S rRNA pseudouridine955/2504/2580 synthase
VEKKVQWVTVDESKEGQRLDNFLSNQLKGLPKGRIYKMIRTGEVRINKGRCKPDSRVSAGDIVRIPPVDLGSHERSDRTPRHSNEIIRCIAV